MKNLYIIVLFALVLVGCQTEKFGDERPPNKHVGRTKVLVLDQSQRPKSAAVEILRDTPNRPNKSIALMTCDGNPDEEMAITAALIFRARMLGGDAIVLSGQPFNTDLLLGGRGSIFGIGGTRINFKANVLVYLDPPPALEKAGKP